MLGVRNFDRLHDTDFMLLYGHKAKLRTEWHHTFISDLEYKEWTGIDFVLS